MIRKYDPRLIIGSLLVFGGLLSLLETAGVIGNAGGIFWGLIWGAAGLYFLYLLWVDRTRNWWAAFPGFVLLGMAVSSFLPESLDAFGGLAFFGVLSLAFLWVYFTDTVERWWAIIPAGVLLTLGAVSVLDALTDIDTGGVLFLGLGLTFVLVAILPGGSQRTWAFIPAALLLIFGALLLPTLGLTAYAGPALLILLGAFLVFRFFKPGA